MNVVREHLPKGHITGGDNEKRITALVLMEEQAVSGT